MTIWRTQSTSEQPSLTLVRWSVREIQDAKGTARVLVGFCVENREGRTSSELASIDHDTLVCTTATGRSYRLQGAPALDSDAEYVFERWCAINQVTSAVNVTTEVWGRHLKSKPPAGSQPN